MPLFRRNNEKDTISVEEETTGEQHDLTEEVLPELSFKPNGQVKPEHVYVLKFKNKNLPTLKPNQLNLAMIEAGQVEQGGVLIQAFVRSSLDKPIQLGETSLLLLDAEGGRIGQKTIDLSEMGELPAKSSTPWSFHFTQEDLTKNDYSLTDCRLAFELKKTHELDLEDSWEKSLAVEDKEQLKSVVAKLKAPKPGEVNFMGLQAKKGPDDLQVTLLIRNGSDKNIQIENLPLKVQDASGDIVAQGSFKLEQLEVKANTSKPWTFIFPASLILKEEPDLSSWKVVPVQN